MCTRHTFQLVLDTYCAGKLVKKIYVAALDMLLYTQWMLLVHTFEVILILFGSESSILKRNSVCYFLLCGSRLSKYSLQSSPLCFVLLSCCFVPTSTSEIQGSTLQFSLLAIHNIVLQKCQYTEDETKHFRCRLR